jgi:prepilin-type processing-associated H-X9-DG protein
MDPTSELTLDAIMAQGGINDGSEGIGSWHTGGFHVALCDGSVQFFAETIQFELLAQMIIRNDGQPYPLW